MRKISQKTIEKFKETLKKTKAQLAVYRQAVLKEAFGKVEDTIWLGEIIDSRLGKMLDKTKNVGTPRQYLRNTNVRWFSFDLSDLLEMKIEDDEIEKYYNENIFGEIKASHILISTNTKADATEEEKAKAEKEALEKAKKVIKELNKGKKFKDLAKKYSDDKATSSNGGDLGYFQLGDMVIDFSNAVKELKKNEYTKEPVKTQYGYHIILRTGEKDRAKLEDVKDDIKEKIRENKLNEDKTLYYETLKEIREYSKEQRRAETQRGRKS